MTAQPNLRGRPRRQESEDSILDAVIEILSADGYAGLTTDKVVAHAKVSKSTIYRRWPTKEHMVLAAFERLPPLDPPNTGELVRDLVDHMQQFLKLLHETPLGRVLPVFMAERLHNTSLAEAFDAYMAERRLTTVTILERALERGDLPRKFDMDLALDLIWGPIILRAFLGPGDTRRPARTALAEAVIRAISAGEKTRPRIKA